MSETPLDWEDLVTSHLSETAQLLGALFTTYDRPDERFLVEHLLPELLHLARSPTGHGAEDRLFLVELHDRLQRLHDRIVVVSSTARDEQPDGDSEPSAHPWIWRSIRHLTVGSEGRAVQHAKLWMLHWDDHGQESLELIVSSANLTLASLRRQLQAGFRVCLPLQPRSSQARQAGWGILPKFLQELARSTGDATRLGPFMDLLGRAECPPGVGFLGSVPGRHSRATLASTPWGLAGLSAMTPPGRGAVTSVVLSPYIGTWSPEALERWTLAFEGAPRTLHLLWIDREHPWARAGWLLPKATLDALVQVEARIHRLPAPTDDAEPLLHPKHRPQDPRWSHAKVYALKRGRATRLLVTSANFSPAAWGQPGADGSLTLENFELGVWQEGASWPETLPEPFEDPHDAATVALTPSRSPSAILWAEASWDGVQVVLRCRCTGPLKAQIEAQGTLTEVSRWLQGEGKGPLQATIPWTDPVPASVLLQSDDEGLTLAVFDARPVAERETSCPPGLDPQLAEQLRDELLFEQYGGAVAPEDDDSAPAQGPAGPGAEEETTASVPPDGDAQPGMTSSADSYAVPVFEVARRHLGIVDHWAERLGLAQAAQGTARALTLQALRSDGERLRAAFGRQAERDRRTDPPRALGAQLAQEEMHLQLQHFPED